MTSHCQAIQESLVEHAGARHHLGQEQQQHLAACAECRAIAESEGELQKLLAEAVPPYDPELVQQVLKALPRPSRWRQLIAFLPVAASLLLATCGALLAGGVPGSSLLPLLPRWSTQGGVSLMQGLFDWSVVLPVLSNALQAEIMLSVTAALVAVSGASLTGLVLLTQRQRKLHRWQEAG
jgi:anti-sigma factor RsiW